jgi:hypothetical protein
VVICLAKEKLPMACKTKTAKAAPKAAKPKAKKAVKK